ncbi:uncharacterized protein [Choristoneura fumiferana]|uniref:uncharacterized protein n=1 Tax=Choristoneura fumiferana TaxID=7141 RepID=UPI003D15BD81
MGYYCTVPQCTSLAGKTKNVKFHRFPRDTTMADKWNVILKRGKPYTKYSKVCSLHFTQSDYNVTNMGQWKTLSKDAVPSQNLPKLNPDGTVMVIRKSRTLKYKDGKKRSPSKYSPHINNTERYNKTIISCVSTFVNDDHRTWDVNIPKVQFAINNSVNERQNREVVAAVSVSHGAPETVEPTTTT